MKYAKFITNTKIEFPPKNKGSILNYDLNIEQLLIDGYKQFIEIERPVTNRLYHIEYVETNVIAETIVYDETEEEAEDRLKNQREEQFNRDFFQTSLGYIRRSVSMQEGENKDFLSDLFPTMVFNFTLGATVRVLAYNKPEDFSQEITDWTQYQHWEVLNNQFIQDCSTQLQNDFLPINKGEE